MAGILTFANYIGGPDEIQCTQSFPSNQTQQIYNFHTDITGWTFSADYQTLIVDSIQFSRSGTPNFSESQVIGYFPKQEIVAPFEPQVQDQLAGTVLVTYPANMYQGPIIPDARKNVPIVVFSLTWTDSNTPAQTQSLRWSFIQCWEPDTELGDPTTDPDFTSLI